ncbi:hypothetical protein LLG95_13670 [bacterium]|nr:hypothetical protein [bacterium]
MRNLVCLLIAAAVCAMACRSHEMKKIVALTPETARATLLQTEVFATTSVGFKPKTSDQVKAFRVILAQPNARDEFRILLINGKLAGRLYGLCGLYLTDRKTFDQSAKPYLAMKQPIGFMEADTFRQEPVCNIVSNTRAGISDIISGEFPNDFAGGRKLASLKN